MCGIFGYAAWRGPMPAVGDLCRLTNLLRHRGPDAGGYWAEPGVFLGHRRLSILDLASGDQPMTDVTGRYVVTFNGEIYNYVELRDRLRREGAVFRTTSDTEVILAGYAAWGTDVVERLEGMFAFGLYDRLAGTLLLARDRFGEKPLLVAQIGGAVAFASELAPLAALPSRARAIDPDALGSFLCLNYVPGTRTLLQGVERLGPGEWREYGSDVPARRASYWSLAAEAERLRASGEPLTVDALQGRIDRAVHRTLRSDVPVGLFLSGGVDSSIVAESAARQGRLEAAFCLDVGEAGFSEWEGASLVARRLKLELVRVPFRADILGEFLDVASHLDDPLADSSAMAVWTVARAAAARLKVVLSGDGGDELFCGYLTYPASRAHAVIARLVPRSIRAVLTQVAGAVSVSDRHKVGWDDKLRRFLRALPLDTAEAHFAWNGTWLPDQAATLARGPASAAAASAFRTLVERHRLPPSPSIPELQLADTRDYLPNDILAKVDRATMAHGLESRAPLLDPSVAAFAAALPMSARLGPVFGTKRLLRDLCARHFGERHATAPKQGFSIPVHQWLRGTGRGLVEDLLAPDRIAALGVIEPNVVRDAVASHMNRRCALGWELWGLMVLVTWFEQRVVDPPNVARLPEPIDLVCRGQVAR